MNIAVENAQERYRFSIRVMGRTLEHLGVQMYKQRSTAIAELVANCWDAGAGEVHIEVPGPDDYDRGTSRIVIRDTGTGMNRTEIQEAYLVVGRNRRASGPEEVHGRLPMGRKGIGKLAGFGIAKHMSITTWQGEEAIRFVLDAEKLKRDVGVSEDEPIFGDRVDIPGDFSDSGTIITLTGLKHAAAIDIDKLHESLGRRFSRRVRGEMVIYINGEQLRKPDLDLELRFPEGEDDYAHETLSDGSEVYYYYAFAKDTIKHPEMRGFTVMVREKTAQAPPFYFDVEGTASGQHSTRYLTGEIKADFLDQGTDDESDLISTDRQEIDWDSDKTKCLRDWGEALTRRVLRERAGRKGDVVRKWVLDDAAMKERIGALDGPSQTQIAQFLGILGEAESDKDQALELAGALIRAYEFRQFHNVVEQIEDVAEDPEKLQELLIRLRDWMVLESRAILEIVKGRLDIVEKFHKMIVNDAPETASSTSTDNMHDLIGQYPWLLNPEWQVLDEERSISKQLRDWDHEDIQDDDARMRYDFLALADERRLVVVEIKRSGHAVTLDELQRLERYRERLAKATDKEMFMLLVHGGTLDVTAATKNAWNDRPDADVTTWGDVYERVRKHYGHYQAVLEGNVRHGSFARKQAEVAQTRSVLQSGTVHRGSEARAAGLGVQDVNYVAGDEDSGTSVTE